MPHTIRREASTRQPTRFALTIAGIVTAGLLLAGCAAPAEADSMRPQPDTASSPEGVSVISAIEPASGSVSGGTKLTISGSGLSKVTAVTIGGVAATDVAPGEDGTVTVTAPPALDYQPADAPIVVSAGETVIEQSTPLTYGYVVETGVDAQMQYAYAHWNNYNVAEWGNLNPVGGDCANFVSQTLIQRGWKQDSNWYNHNAAASWSPRWGYVPAMNDWFAAEAPNGVSKLTLEQRDQVKVGDVAMFDWNQNDTPDHVMIVGKVFTEGDKTVIQLVGHNKDFDYRDLDNTITVEHPGGNAWFWSVPA